MGNHSGSNLHHGATTTNRSIFDTDEEFHTSHSSPLQPDEVPSSHPSARQLDEVPSSPSKAIVVVDQYHPNPSFRPLTTNHQKPPQNFNLPPSVKAQTGTVAYNRTEREEPVTGVTRAGTGGVEDGNGGAGGQRRSVMASPRTRRVKRELLVERSALGFRVLEVILSLIAFSVMASDKTQGWSGDSFDRYMEYRYVVAVNAIAFAYAAFQAIDLTYHLIYGKHIISYPLRPQFDFLMDQILAYLLMSASSSAATRVTDWVSNWGKDEFTELATASIGMSFLAFLAFALSSLISGYILCNQTSL